MKTVYDLKVGDAAWWVDVNGKGAIYEGTVTKVGSKLIELGRRSYRKDSLRTNDQYGHQTLIPDLEFYNERQEASHILGLIKNRIGYGMTSIPIENVKKAADLLGISIGDDE